MLAKTWMIAIATAVLGGCGPRSGVASAACWNDVSTTGDEWIDLGGDAVADPPPGAHLSLKGATPDGRIKVELGEQTKVRGIAERKGIRLFARKTLRMTEGLMALPGAEVFVSRISGRRVRATVGRVSKWIDCGMLTPSGPTSETGAPKGNNFLRGDQLITVDAEGKFGLLYIPGGEDVRIVTTETDQNRVAVEGEFKRIRFRGWVEVDAVSLDPSGLQASQATEGWGPAVRCKNTRDAVTSRQASLYRHHGDEGASPSEAAVAALPIGTSVTAITHVGQWRLVVVPNLDPSLEHLVGWVQHGDLDKPTCE